MRITQGGSDNDFLDLAHILSNDRCFVEGEYAQELARCHEDFWMVSVVGDYSCRTISDTDRSLVHMAPVVFQRLSSQQGGVVIVVYMIGGALIGALTLAIFLMVKVFRGWPQK